MAATVLERVKRQSAPSPSSSSSSSSWWSLIAFASFFSNSRRQVNKPHTRTHTNTAVAPCRGPPTSRRSIHPFINDQLLGHAGGRNDVQVKCHVTRRETHGRHSRVLNTSTTTTCARHASDEWPVIWVNLPLQVSQLGQLSLSSFRGR